MKLPKLAITLPPSLKRLWAPRPKVLPTRDEPTTQWSATASGIDSEAVARSILTALEIQSSPSTRSNLHSRTSKLTILLSFSVFRLPDELFLAIFTNFPVLEWSDLYYRYSHAFQYTHIPDVFGERIQALLTLSATCRAMRYRFLPEAWERNLMCLKTWSQNHEIPVRLQLQHRTLTNDCRLAAYVRYVSHSSDI